MKKLLLALILFASFVKADDLVTKVKRIGDYESTYMCSAFPLRVKDEIIGITAKHCCVNEKTKKEQAYLVVEKAHEKFYVGRVRGVYSKSDICAFDWGTAVDTFEIGSEIYSGDPVTTQGFPGGKYVDLYGTFSGSYFYNSTLNDSALYMAFFIAGSGPGASGSPIFDSSGGVVSVLSAGNKEYVFGVSLTDLKAFMKELNK